MTEPEEKPWVVGYGDDFKGARVEAAQLSARNIGRVAAWCNGFWDFDSIAIKTPWGVQIANLGDWILKAPDGTFRVATDAQMQRSYERKYNVHD